MFIKAFGCLNKINLLPYSDLTFFLCIVFKRDLNAMVLLVLKAESVEQMVHLFGHIWAKHVKRISRVIGHGWKSLVMKLKCNNLCYIMSSLYPVVQSSFPTYLVKILIKRT